MDSLTQIVLGAAVAEAAAGKKMGNKAAFWELLLVQFRISMYLLELGHTQLMVHYFIEVFHTQLYLQCFLVQ